MPNAEALPEFGLVLGINGRAQYSPFPVVVEWEDCDEEK
jgi:hypothetical protein